MMINCKVYYILLIILVCIGVGCTLDSTKELGNDYLLVTSNSYNNAIVKGSASIVDTNVTDYLVISNYVVGYRKKSIQPDYFNYSENFGYFILNIKDGSLIEGLNREDFLRKVTSLELTNAHHISR